MNLAKYILDKYDGSLLWFEKEVELMFHKQRISKIIAYKAYLSGSHKIKLKKDINYKEQEFKTKKLIIKIAKTILNFHSTYILGKPISFTGTEEKIAEYNKIYRKGNFNNVDFKIADRINKYGDCYEYVYYDDIDKIIKSKFINAEDGYPVYDDQNNYIGFIEYYTTSDNVSYYVIYYPDRVESWDNKNTYLTNTDSRINLTGLPIHYHNENEDDTFGSSILEDITPILDEIEEILSKCGDTLYTLSLNPIPVITGQRIENSIPAEACGYVLNLELGSEFTIPTTTLDKDTIKFYYDSLRQSLLDVSSTPSVAMNATTISNVSETSLKMLYQLADAQAMLNEKYIRLGFFERFKKFDTLLSKMGIEFDDNIAYIDVEFNFNRPVNTKDIINNLKTQKDMGAISIQTIVEKSPLTNDTPQEMDRLKKEGNKAVNNEVV